LDLIAGNIKAGVNIFGITGTAIEQPLCGDTVSYAGESYPIVQIGSQCWFAKNLNVGTMVTGPTTQTNNSTIEKYCYNNDTAQCTTYGGLYQWNEMMAYTTTAGAQGICPSGWHLPTDTEWKTLVESQSTLGCESSTGWQCDPAGTKLKTGGSSGFNGLLAGYRNTDGSFYSQGTYTILWSSSESGTNAWNRYLHSSNSTVRRNTLDKASGFSVRCLQD
jgi:uncharacterized protein (TIGR02145 family)